MMWICLFCWFQDVIAHYLDFPLAFLASDLHLIRVMLAGRVLCLLSAFSGLKDLLSVGAV